MFVTTVKPHIMNIDYRQYNMHVIKCRSIPTDLRALNIDFPDDSPMTTEIGITITCEDFIRRKLDGNIMTKGFEGKAALIKSQAEGSNFLHFS